jgi:hypothetical protein
MKQLPLIALLLLLSNSIPALAQFSKTCDWIVLAEVMQIGEKPTTVSGHSMVTWDVTYSIIDVLKGRLTKAKIHVGHIVLKGNELDDLRVGDKALVCLTKKNSMEQLDAEYLGEMILINCNKCIDRGK